MQLHRFLALKASPSFKAQKHEPNMYLGNFAWPSSEVGLIVNEVSMTEVLPEIDR
jgi:hypothetical protein